MWDFTTGDVSLDEVPVFFSQFLLPFIMDKILLKPFKS